MKKNKNSILFGIIIYWLGFSAAAVTTPVIKPLDVAVITHPVFMCGSGRAQADQVERPSFESIPSRPLALSSDGSLLFVANTVANCLEIFDVRGSDINLLSSVSVGVDPVSVQLRNATEVWVVNHLSDSISIVDISGTPHVKETLPVGDEPWDIVFADNQKTSAGRKTNRKNRVFISSAFRGQSHPQFKTQYLYQTRLNAGKKREGELIGRADLWVFDIDNKKNRPTLSGIVNLFADSVRSLAVSEDGSRVFAATFKSGNRTAAIDVGFDDLLLGKWSSDGVGNPEPKLIVQEKGKRWVDEFGRDWSGKLGANIADNDLFVIDATQEIKLGNQENPIFNRSAIIKTIKGIGTTLFNIAANEKYIFVSGIDANNTIATVQRLKGVFVNNLLATIDIKKNYTVSVKSLDSLRVVDSNLNSHAIGAALPAGIELVDDQIYIATMGGNNILKLASGVGKNSDNIPGEDVIDFSNAKQWQSDGGPIGIKIDPKNKRLFVYTKFDNKISIYKQDGAGINKLSNAYGMTDGEEENIKQGRRYFYDANLTSEKGNVACASCHIFGGTDKLQWDLGNADAPLEFNELPFLEHSDPSIGSLKATIRTIRLNLDPGAVSVGDSITLGDKKIPVVFKGDKQDFARLLESGKISLETSGLVYIEGGADEKKLYKYNLSSVDRTWAIIGTPFFHPLKGPMLTLPLYGIADSGAMHFRGDVQGKLEQNGKPCAVVQGSNERRALNEFNTPCDGTTGVFENLLGGEKLDEKKMQFLSDFLLSLTYPPNPVRPLNNSYTNAKGAGIFFSDRTVADIKDHQRLVERGPLVFRCVDCHTLDRQNRNFGTSRMMYSAPTLTQQDTKIPHLRFLYDRVGYFYGNGKEEIINATGFNHGGALVTEMFFFKLIWILNQKAEDAESVSASNPYADLFEFLMGFDTNEFPMYGQQISLMPQQGNFSLSKRDEKKEAEKFQQYVQAIFSPMNMSVPQCSVHFNSVTVEGKVGDFVMTKNDISGEDGNISPDIISKFIKSTKKSSDFPTNFICL